MGPFDVIERVLVNAVEGAQRLLHVTAAYWGQEMDMRAGAGRFSAFSAFSVTEDSNAAAEAPTASLLGRLTTEPLHR